MNDQPEALRVADLMAQRVKPIWISAGFKPDRECVAAARLLREQHAEIERLRRVLKGIETLKVTVDGVPAGAYQTEGWMRELAREALEETK